MFYIFWLQALEVGQIGSAWLSVTVKDVVARIR